MHRIGHPGTFAPDEQDIGGGEGKFQVVLCALGRQQDDPPPGGARGGEERFP